MWYWHWKKNELFCVAGFMSRDMDDKTEGISSSRKYIHLPTDLVHEAYDSSQD